jgi:FAD/FMN-containing dehydrogenase
MATTHADVADMFRSTFTGETFALGQDGYEQARGVWNATVGTRPALIARCRDTGEVAAAVKLARSAGVSLAVRGGGHSLPGFSSCDGGVVIDLTGMRGVDVDPRRRVATAAGGATWADFDTATARHGLACTGGLISSTGVAGLTLGGGIGWLQRRYGLACDNLRGAQMVTADTEVVDADESLLWGLRGGGGNFGIVTRFEFDLHEVSTVLAGLLMFPVERGAEVLRTFRDWAATAPEEASLLAAVNTAPPEPFVPAELVGKPVVVIVGCWCGDPAAGAAALAPLRSLAPAVDLFGPMPYTALQGMLDATAPAGLRNYFRGGYLADLTDDVIDIALDQATRMRSPLSQIHFHQMGGAISRYGTSTSSFSGRDAGYTYNLIGTWLTDAEDAVHITEVRDLAAALLPLSMHHNYVNFDTETDTQRAHEAYGSEIYQRLARLKRQYDPINLFSRNHNIRPAP